METFAAFGAFFIKKRLFLFIELYTLVYGSSEYYEIIAVLIKLAKKKGEKKKTEYTK